MANLKRTVVQIDSLCGHKSFKLYLEDDGKYWITCDDDYESFNLQIDITDVTSMFSGLQKEQDIIVREHNARTIEISTHEFRNRFPKRNPPVGVGPQINANAVEVYKISKEYCLGLGITSQEFETRFKK